MARQNSQNANPGLLAPCAGSLPSCPDSWTLSPREGSWELNASDVEKSLSLGGPGVHEGCKEPKARSSNFTLPRVGSLPAYLQGPCWHSCLVLPLSDDIYDQCQTPGQHREIIRLGNLGTWPFSPL